MFRRYSLFIVTLGLALVSTSLYAGDDDQLATFERLQSRIRSQLPEGWAVSWDVAEPYLGAKTARAGPGKMQWRVFGAVDYQQRQAADRNGVSRLRPWPRAVSRVAAGDDCAGGSTVFDSRGIRTAEGKRRTVDQGTRKR